MPGKIVSVAFLSQNDDIDKYIAIYSSSSKSTVSKRSTSLGGAFNFFQNNNSNNLHHNTLKYNNNKYNNGLNNNSPHGYPSPNFRGNNNGNNNNNNYYSPKRFFSSVENVNRSISFSDNMLLNNHSSDNLTASDDSANKSWRPNFNMIADQLKETYPQLSSPSSSTTPNSDILDSSQFALYQTKFKQNPTNIIPDPNLTPNMNQHPATFSNNTIPNQNNNNSINIAKRASSAAVNPSSSINKLDQPFFYDMGLPSINKDFNLLIDTSAPENKGSVLSSPYSESYKKASLDDSLLGVNRSPHMRKDIQNTALRISSLNVGGSDSFFNTAANKTTNDSIFNSYSLDWKLMNSSSNSNSNLSSASNKTGFGIWNNDMSVWS